MFYFFDIGSGLKAFHESEKHFLISFLIFIFFH